MSGDDDAETNRRQVVRAAAAAGTVGIGASLVTGHSGVSGDGATPGNPETVLAESGVVSASDGPTGSGERLLARLAADGLIDEPSYDALPASRLSADGVGFHRSSTDPATVVFLLRIERGTLHVIFSEVTPPMARIVPDGDAEPIWYVSDDGYSRATDSALRVDRDAFSADTSATPTDTYIPSQTDPGTASVTDGSCGYAGCNDPRCYESDCAGGDYTRVSYVCKDGFCVEDTSCC